MLNIVDSYSDKEPPSIPLVESPTPRAPNKRPNPAAAAPIPNKTGNASNPILPNTANENPSAVNAADNPKIPPPNFTGNPATTGETLPESDLEIFNRKRRDQQKRYNDQLEITRTAKAALDNAVEVMPAGDPAIAVLKNQYETQYLKTLTITEELTTLT